MDSRSSYGPAAARGRSRRCRSLDRDRSSASARWSCAIGRSDTIGRTAPAQMVRPVGPRRRQRHAHGYLAAFTSARDRIGRHRGRLRRPGHPLGGARPPGRRRASRSLRHPLYDIDRIVSNGRSPTASSPSLLVGRLPESPTSPWFQALRGSFAAEGNGVGRRRRPPARLAAALFNAGPAPGPADRRTDRFDRARYDAERTTTAFAERLRDAPDLGDRDGRPRSAGPAGDGAIGDGRRGSRAGGAAMSRRRPPRQATRLRPGPAIRCRRRRPAWGVAVDGHRRSSSRRARGDPEPDLGDERAPRSSGSSSFARWSSARCWSACVPANPIGALLLVGREFRCWPPASPSRPIRVASAHSRRRSNVARDGAGTGRRPTP